MKYHIAAILISIFLGPLAEAAQKIDLNELVDSLDYDSPAYQIKFRENIIPIMNTGNINDNDFKMILTILKNINLKSPSLFFQMLENELLKLDKLIQGGVSKNKTDYIKIFQAKVSHSAINDIRTKLCKIPIEIYNNNRLALITNTRDLNLNPKKPLQVYEADRKESKFNFNSTKYDR